MKKILIYFLIILFLYSCSGSGKNTTDNEIIKNNNTTKTAQTIQKSKNISTTNNNIKYPINNLYLIKLEKSGYNLLKSGKKLIEVGYGLDGQFKNGLSNIKKIGNLLNKENLKKLNEVLDKYNQNIKLQKELIQSEIKKMNCLNNKIHNRFQNNNIIDKKLTPTEVNSNNTNKTTNNTPTTIKNNKKVSTKEKTTNNNIATKEF